jgi:hypothetical protein
MPCIFINLNALVHAVLRVYMEAYAGVGDLYFLAPSRSRSLARFF